MTNKDLNKQAQEILEIAEKHGVEQNFFFLTTFKRYQVQLSILNDLEKTIKKAGGDILDSIKLFDIYEGAQIPEGKKSIAYAIFFRAADRSLTNEEIARVYNKIIKDLEYKNGAQLR